MPTVNLALTFASTVSGSVTSPTNIYTDNGAEASYAWSGSSGLHSCRYSTNFASAVPSGATVTGYRLLIRCRKSSLSFYPLPSFRWGDTGGQSALGDYDLSLTEAQYAYPPSGYYTTPPSTWDTIDIGGSLNPAGTVTLFIDEVVIEVEYTAPPAGNALFLGENF